MVILDTGLAIDYMHGVKKAKDALTRYRGQQVGITILTKYELIRGESERNTVAIRSLLENSLIYYFTDAATEEAARIYNDLKRRGKPIQEIDMLIAAISIVNGETLLASDGGFSNIRSTNIIVV
jgi:predicted nucleic acid-binding protein